MIRLDLLDYNAPGGLANPTEQGRGFANPRRAF